MSSARLYVIILCDLPYLQTFVNSLDYIKNTLEIENFSGRTENAIRQDFYINMITSNIMAAAYWESQEIVDKTRNNPDNANKYSCKVNVSQLSGTVRDYLISAILAKSPTKRRRLLFEMADYISDSVIPVRPDRNVPRKSAPRKAKFHHNYKSNLWVCLNLFTVGHFIKSAKK